MSFPTKLDSIALASPVVGDHAESVLGEEQQFGHPMHRNRAANRGKM